MTIYDHLHAFLKAKLTPITKHCVVLYSWCVYQSYDLHHETIFLKIDIEIVQIYGQTPQRSCRMIVF
jgi:hypothetical protein